MKLGNRLEPSKPRWRGSEMRSKVKPKFYQCGRCGRFVKIIAAGEYMDDFGYWIIYDCKKCGVRVD